MKWILLSLLISACISAPAQDTCRYTASNNPWHKCTIMQVPGLNRLVADPYQFTMIVDTVNWRLQTWTALNGCKAIPAIIDTKQCVLP